MGLLGQRVALDVFLLVGRGAGAELVPAGPDPAGEMGHHAAAVVDQELEVRVALQHPGEHDPRHEGRQVVLPAERPPDLVARPLLCGVVGPPRVAARVDLEQAAGRGHRGVERVEPRVVHGLAADVRVDLRAERAELAPRVLVLGHRGLGIVHRHAGAEPGEAVRVGPDELGHGLVADPGHLLGDLRGAEVLHRRRADVDDLAVVAELVHLREADIHVDQARDVRHPLAQVRGVHGLGEREEAVVVGARHDVTEGVYLHSSARYLW